VDNVTHTLTGLALSRAGLNRFCPYGTLLMILAANVPDIDMVSLFHGRLTSLEIHRGYTHSLICLPLMALLPVALTALITRRRLPWKTAWILSCLGVTSHLLLDWTMSYGIRFLLPFSSRWFYLDIFSLIDWVVLAVLAFAWLGPAFGKLVSNEIGSKPGGGRGLAIFALLFFLAYGGFRAVMHSRVMAQLESRIYDEALQGPATRMAAFSDSVNPFRWNAIVEGEHAYRLYDISPYGNFDPASGELLYKANWNSELQKVSESHAFRYSLYFARFPYWQESPAEGADRSTAVRLTDLRFGRPGESFFSLQAIVDATGRIVHIDFGRP
jgi:inner membrane protein